MQPLQTQTFLRAHGLTLLCAKYAIKANRHPDYPNLVLLGYDQLNSPMAEPVVRECRGLILDEADNWSVVCRPFDKFFNYGEKLATPIDWKSAQRIEKLDGSLMSVYFYDGRRHVASSGHPSAGGSMGTRTGWTMAESFWETWAALGYDSMTNSAETMMAQRCLGWTFMFEFMTPWNQVVVPHESSRIVLIGVRDPLGKERSPSSISAMLGWDVLPERVPVSCLQEAIEAAAPLNGRECEGFIVCDAAFNRVKVKAPSYVRLHLLRDSISRRRMVEILQTGEGEEFLSYFPYFEPEYRKLEARYLEMCSVADAEYDELKHIEDPREFAAAARSCTYPDAVFGIRSGRFKTSQDFYSKMLLTSLVNRLRVADDALIVSNPE